MTNKRKRKHLLWFGLWGAAAFVAGQIYQVRELLFAWLIFFLLFWLMAASLFLLFVIYETIRTGLNWIAPRILAARSPNGARLARSH